MIQCTFEWFSKSNDPHEHCFELVLWTLRDTLFREAPTFQPYEHVLKLLLLFGQHALETVLLKHSFVQQNYGVVTIYRTVLVGRCLPPNNYVGR